MNSSADTHGASARGVDCVWQLGSRSLCIIFLRTREKLLTPLFTMSRTRHHHQHQHQQHQRFRGGGDDEEVASNVAYFTYPTIRGGSLVVAAEYAEPDRAQSLSGGGGDGPYFTLGDPDGLDGGSADEFDDLDTDLADGAFLYGGKSKTAAHGHGKARHEKAQHKAQQGKAHRRKSSRRAGKSYQGKSRSRDSRDRSESRESSGIRGGIEAGVGDAGQLFFTVPVLGGGNQGTQSDCDDGHDIFGG